MSETANKTGLRLIDHCVLPVADLGVAAQRLEALGFTVAPVGRHPFGTANVCVYFKDDTFLEALAVADSREVAQAIRDRNVFVQRDDLFRSREGQEGFSAVVVKTDDARQDHTSFVGQGISAGPVLDFSRPFVDAAGAQSTVSFRLAFAAPESQDSCYFFSCQRIPGNLPGKPASLTTHANGVTGIARVVLSADADGDPAAFVRSVFGGDTQQCEVAVKPATDRWQLTAIAFDVSNIAVTRGLLEQRSIAFDVLDGRLIVPAAAGQGTVFIFEE